MSRVFNFSAGPAVLPVPVLEQVQREMLEYDGVGASVMEISHRGSDFIEIAARAEADLRELMGIPENYKVLFLQGGATLQFAMVPLNLLGENDHVDYVNTGHWSVKAITEAKRFAQVNVVASGEESKFTTIPSQSNWNLDETAAYLHYTPNETIAGVEFNWVPETGNVPLVADMSSNVLSRPVDVSRYGLIYAGAQKNLGPAGITIVIVRDDLIGKMSPRAPSLFDYAKQADAASMLNTAPTFAWYVVGLVLQWLRAQGGVDAMAQLNQAKADKLYAAVDASDGFYRNPVDTSCRSRMNVPFILRDPDLDKTFLEESVQAGLAALKGHRSVGGMRASIYNAMPMEGVDALIEFMNQFQKRYG